MLDAAADLRASARVSIDDVLGLPQRSERMGEAPALLAPGRAGLTYRALSGALASARHELRSAGVRAGEVVAVPMYPGPESLALCIAIAAESACAPLDPSLSRDEYQFFLSRLGASTIVVQDAEVPAALVARELGMRVIRAIPEDGEPAGSFRLEPIEPAADTVKVRRTDAVLLLFTSSTTGTPKLVPASASNLRARFGMDGSALGLRSDDRYLSFMPLFHLHGLSAALTQLSRGGSVVCTPGFDPARFADWWRVFRPTWFSAGVPLLNAISAVVPSQRELFAAAPPRFIRMTGAIPETSLRERVEHAMRAPVLSGYGLTEAGSTTRIRLGEDKPGSVGRSVGTQIAIGEEAEILLRGPAVLPGYLDDEEANRQAFRNGWFRTGDLGRMDADGFLYITGRLKEIINRGGEKILPGEVDRVLADCPGVKEAAAFGIPHPTLGEDIAAAVVRHPDANISEAELRRHAASRLAPFKVPRRFVFLDAIPRTPSGKPKRASLASEYASLAALDAASGAPVSEIERRLIAIWSRILRHQEIGVDDSFWELGGDSLAATVMLVETDHAFQTGGRLLARSDFFDSPTIAALAEMVIDCEPFSKSGQAPDLGFPPALAFHSGGACPAIFFCPGWRGHAEAPMNPYYLRHLSSNLERQLYILMAAVPSMDDSCYRAGDLVRSAIAAMRSVQPRGPYILAGHCLGAVIAFEAAKRLLSEGEAVSKLLLFDAPAPGYPKIGKNWKRYAAELRRLSSGLDLRQVKQHALVLAQIAGRRARAAIGRSANDRRGIALAEHTPGECRIPIVHFIAADQAVSTRVLDDPRYGWRDLARAGIEFRMARGDHASMFHTENAPALAHQIHASLGTA